MEIRLDRAVGDPEVLGDLGDRQSTEVVKADRNPLLLWELRKRCSEVEQFGGQVCFEGWSDSRQDLSASSTVTPAIQQSMKRRASHPGCGIVVSADLAPLAVGSDECFLNRIRSRLGVEGEQRPHEAP